MKLYNTLSLPQNKRKKTIKKNHYHYFQDVLIPLPVFLVIENATKNVHKENSIIIFPLHKTT